MRLRSLAVEGMKRFRERRAFELHTTAVNVIHGPNGSGKSTLLDAMHLVFLARHNSSAASVASLVPWGTALSPKVVAEFEAGGEIWQASKSFLNEASSALELRSGQGWKLFAKGAQADDKLRSFLGGEEGAKASKDLLLASVLWTPQGRQEVQDVPASVRAALASQLDSPEARRLLTWIEKRAESYWTPTGKVQKHSPAAAAKHELEEMDRRAHELNSELEAIEELRDRIVGTEASLVSGREELAALNSELKELRRQLNETTAIRNKVDVLKPQADAARAEVSSLLSAVKTVEKAKESLALVLPKIAAHEASGEDPAAAQAVARREYDDALAAHAASVSFRALLRERDEADQRAEKLRALFARSAGVEGEIRGLNAPGTETLSKLQEADGSLRLKQAQLEGALLHLDARGERPLRMEILEGEPQGPVTLSPGENVRFSGSPTLRFRIEGVGEFQVSGPVSSASKLRLEVSKLRDERERLAAGFGTSDIEELARRERRASELKAELESLRRHWEDLSLDKSDVEWQQESIRLSTAIETQLQSRPEWRTAVPDPASLEAVSAGLRQRVDALESSVEVLAELRSTARSEQARIAITLDHSKAGSLEDLQAAESTRRTKLAGMEAQLAELNTALASFPEGLSEREADLSRRVLEVTERVERQSKSIQTMNGQLDEKLARAPAASLGALMERRTVIEEKAKQESLLGDAWLVLRTTASESRAAMMEGVAEPVAQRATEILNSIGLTHIGDVRLTSDLAPMPLRPPGASGDVAVEAVSGGEFEQVHFAARLALAEFISRAEPQLAVFDDSFLSTDDTRLARMLELLEQATATIQPLILTCHPERYLPALPRANFIEM